MSRLHRSTRSSSPLVLLLAVALTAVWLGGCGRTRPDTGVREATVPASTAPRATPGAPEPASVVVANAVKRAATEQKVVLIEFGASWCKWCTNFQNFVNSKEVGAIVAENYIVTPLVVLEEGDKQALENPGGETLMLEWAGQDEPAVPFYVFLDSNGRKIADSNAMPGNKNIGFPYTREEIDVFMQLVDRTAPRLDPSKRAALLAYLRSIGEQSKS